MTNLITILLTSGVIASVVTSIINLISIRNTNKRLIQVEKLKNDYTIRTFRYTKLYELNSELNNLPDIDYTFLEKKDGKLVHSKEKLAKVIGESTNRHSDFVKIFLKAKPLFDTEIILECDNFIRKEKEESNRIVQALYTSEGNTDISSLMEIRSQLEIEFKNTIIKQLEALIKI